MIGALPAGHERVLLLSGLGLLLGGFLISLTASPHAAEAMGYTTTFAFALRHAAFALAAAVALVAASRLPPVGVRRLGAVGLLVALVLLAVTLFVGHEVKGAQRWLRLAGMSLQPAEILKPALVVALAWMLASRERQPGFPGVALACGLYVASAALLLPQPDLGQTILLGCVLGGLLFLAGAPWKLFAAGAGVAVLGGLAAYFGFAHARARIDAFLNADARSYQVSRALDAIASGGVLGRGPGEGVVKTHLPDAHADFVYAAAAEEFGWLASLGLLALYAGIAWVGLRRAARIADPFQRLGACGLLLLFVFQAAIHVAVNASLSPAKGMTLPLVSYGGTALVGSAVTLGLALALLRARPSPPFPELHP